MSQETSNVHVTRTQVVVEAIREKILSGDIAAGKPLRQSALAQSLNVSRIPIREALVQLEAEGLVKFEAHKGATVTVLSAEQVTELFELRALIETDLLQKAMLNMTDAILDKAQAYLDELETAFKNQDSISSWSVLNTKFHSCLYEAANRPHTLEVVHGLNTNCDRYIRLQLLTEGGIPKAEQEHKQLLEYCRKKDIAKATMLLKTHILHAAETIRKLVAKQVG
ncbi:GntR family transcriptional regulator [Shewanella sp. Isolate11]|uniref:GntR family transcriptional regulator n=1 Tax=Shewanella sp. Isolate11 TaxID=2908530 RepID=UPI001EFCE496|nr:GntR family transcriptional regulator [Shewanella sp. Isolate11]MCG9696347.1 GntR family transcriptional regulator [Shewanella sp. Isolate11]